MNDQQTILGKPPSSPPPSGSQTAVLRSTATFSDAATAEVSPDEVVVASTSCECAFGCWECDDTTEWRRV